MKKGLDIFIQVQWLVLPDKCDWTWQPLQELHEDVPERVEHFLRCSRKKLATEALSLLQIPQDK